MPFQKLSVDCLQKIRPMLMSRFPSTAMVLNILDLTVSGKYPDEDRVEFFGYNGVPDSVEEIFLVVMFKPKIQDLFSVIYAPKRVTGEMRNAFCDLFDWSQILQFGAVPEHFAVQLEDIILTKHRGTISKGPAADLYLPVEEALKFDLSRADLSEEFEVDELSPEHARKVSIHWKYGNDQHIPSIAAAIRSIGSAAGVFKKRKSTGETSEVESRKSEDLVSWVVFLRVGTLNALHTVEEFRGKGLARWTMQTACKWAAENNLTPLVEIETYNEASLRLMQKLGFKFIHNVSWLEYKPALEL